MTPPTPSRRGAARDIDKELQALEKEARAALPGFDAQFYNRAGDLCLDNGHRDRALTYYGRAIDAYLKSSRFDSAAAVCRKLLRIAPDAVRTRCTLAWLSIGKGFLGDAQVEVKEYVRAARKAHQQAFATKQLRLMGEAAADPELRELIARELAEMGDDVGAGKVRTQPPPPSSPEAQEDRWSKVLRAALMGPSELKGP